MVKVDDVSYLKIKKQFAKTNDDFFKIFDRIIISLQLYAVAKLF